MARVSCSCGKMLSNTRVPNDVNIWLFEKEFWERQFLNGSVETIYFETPNESYWYCKNCETLLRFDSGESEIKEVFILECSYYDNAIMNIK